MPFCGRTVEEAAIDRCTCRAIAEISSTYRPQGRTRAGRAHPSPKKRSIDGGIAPAVGHPCGSPATTCAAHGGVGLGPVPDVWPPRLRPSLVAWRSSTPSGPRQDEGQRQIFRPPTPCASSSWAKCRRIHSLLLLSPRVISLLSSVQGNAFSLVFFLTTSILPRSESQPAASRSRKTKSPSLPEASRATGAWRPRSHQAGSKRAKPSASVVAVPSTSFVRAKKAAARPASKRLGGAGCGQGPDKRCRLRRQTARQPDVGHGRILRGAGTVHCSEVLHRAQAMRHVNSGLAPGEGFIERGEKYLNHSPRFQLSAKSRLPSQTGSPEVAGQVFQSSQPPSLAEEIRSRLSTHPAASVRSPDAD